MPIHGPPEDGRQRVGQWQPLTALEYVDSYDAAGKRHRDAASAVEQFKHLVEWLGADAAEQVELPPPALPACWPPPGSPRSTTSTMCRVDDGGRAHAGVSFR